MLVLVNDVSYEPMPKLNSVEHEGASAWKCDGRVKAGIQRQLCHIQKPTRFHSHIAPFLDRKFEEVVPSVFCVHTLLH